MLKCQRHPNAHLIEDTHAGDMICPECGLVVGDRVIDVGSEWRTLEGSNDRSRVGVAENPYLEGRELTSYIEPMTGRGVRDGMKGLKKKSGATPGDRNLLHAFQEMKEMADRLNLTQSIVEQAKALYKQYHQEKTLKGRASDAVAAACIYIACREENVPRSFKEICAVSRHPKKEIGKCTDLIKRQRQATSVVKHTVSTSDFMPRYCTNLGLPLPVQKAATHIAKKVAELDLAPGRVHLSVTATAIYLASQASDNKKTQKEVGEVVGVADSTIRQIYRLIYPSKEKLFPPDFHFATPLNELPKH